MAPRRRSVLAALAAGASGGVGGCLDGDESGAACTHETPDPGSLGGTPADAWPMRGYDPAATGANPGASPPALDGATVAWSRSLDAAPEGPPLVAGDGVFVRTGDRVFALTRDGDERWTRGDGDDPGVFAHALDGTSAYLGRRESGEGGHLLAVDAATGEERWRAPTKRIPDAVAATDREVVAGTVAPSGGSDGWVHSLDPGEGSERWRAELDDDVRTRPVVTADLVVAGTGGQDLFGLDRSTGGECWRVDADLFPARTGVSDGRAYLVGAIPGTASNGLQVRDATDGRFRWGLADLPGDPLSTVSRVVAAGGTLLASDGEAVHALAPGATVDWTWERPVEDPGEWVTRVLVVAGGTVLTDAPGSLVSLDLATGERTGSLSVPGRVTGLSAAGGSLYAATRGEDGPRLLAIR